MAKPQLKPFYNSKAWQDARRRALMRDAYTCQMCSGRATEVHHLIELDENNFKDKNISLNLNNLQSLCHECHTKITEKHHHSKRNDVSNEYFFDENGYVQKVLPPGGCQN